MASGLFMDLGDDDDKPEPPTVTTSRDTAPIDQLTSVTPSPSPPPVKAAITANGIAKPKPTTSEGKVAEPAKRKAAEVVVDREDKVKRLKTEESKPASAVETETPTAPVEVAYRVVRKLDATAIMEAVEAKTLAFPEDLTALSGNQLKGPVARLVAALPGRELQYLKDDLSALKTRMVRVYVMPPDQSTGDQTVYLLVQKDTSAPRAPGQTALPFVPTKSEPVADKGVKTPAKPTPAPSSAAMAKPPAPKPAKPQQQNALQLILDQALSAVPKEGASTKPAAAAPVDPPTRSSRRLSAAARDVAIVSAASEAEPNPTKTVQFRDKPTKGKSTAADTEDLTKKKTKVVEDDGLGTDDDDTLMENAKAKTEDDEKTDEEKAEDVEQEKRTEDRKEALRKEKEDQKERDRKEREEKKAKEKKEKEEKKQKEKEEKAKKKEEEKKAKEKKKEEEKKEKARQKEEEKKKKKAKEAKSSSKKKTSAKKTSKSDDSGETKDDKDPPKGDKEGTESAKKSKKDAAVAAPSSSSSSKQATASSAGNSGEDWAARAPTDVSTGNVMRIQDEFGESIKLLHINFMAFFGDLEHLAPTDPTRIQKVELLQAMQRVRTLVSATNAGQFVRGTNPVDEDKIKGMSRPELHAMFKRLSDHVLTTMQKEVLQDRFDSNDAAAVVANTKAVAVQVCTIWEQLSSFNKILELYGTNEALLVLSTFFMVNPSARKWLEDHLVPPPAAVEQKPPLTDSKVAVISSALDKAIAEAVAADVLDGDAEMKDYIPIMDTPPSPRHRGDQTGTPSRRPGDPTGRRPAKMLEAIAMRKEAEAERKETAVKADKERFLAEVERKYIAARDARERDEARAKRELELQSAAEPASERKQLGLGGQPSDGAPVTCSPQQPLKSKQPQPLAAVAPPTAMQEGEDDDGETIPATPPRRPKPVAPRSRRILESDDEEDPEFERVSDGVTQEQIDSTIQQSMKPPTRRSVEDLLKDIRAGSTQDNDDEPAADYEVDNPDDSDVTRKSLRSRLDDEDP